MPVNIQQLYFQYGSPKRGKLFSQQYKEKLSISQVELGGYMVGTRTRPRPRV